MKIQGITRVMVVIGRNSQDEICIDVDWPSPFPDPVDPVSLTLRAPCGKGVEYAASIGLKVDEVVTMPTNQSKFSNR